jgi:hypothetical protein
MSNHSNNSNLSESRKYFIDQSDIVLRIHDSNNTTNKQLYVVEMEIPDEDFQYFDTYNISYERFVKRVIRTRKRKRTRNHNNQDYNNQDYDDSDSDSDSDMADDSDVDMTNTTCDPKVIKTLAWTFGSLFAFKAMGFYLTGHF